MKSGIIYILGGFSGIYHDDVHILDVNLLQLYTSKVKLLVNMNSLCGVYMNQFLNSDSICHEIGEKQEKIKLGLV